MDNFIDISRNRTIVQELVILSTETQNMNFIHMFLFSTTCFSHTSDHHKVEKHRYRRKSVTEEALVALFFLYLCFYLIMVSCMSEKSSRK
jgi:hypothetical protein